MTYNVQPQLENACRAFTFEFNYAIIVAQMTKGTFQLIVYVEKKIILLFTGYQTVVSLVSTQDYFHPRSFNKTLVLLSGSGIYL